MTEARQKYDQASGLALLLDTRPSSAVAFALLYMGLLHGFVLSPQPRPVRRLTPVRQGHRNHGAPPSGACSEPTASRTCPVQSSRSSDPRCIQPAPPSKSVEVLHGYPRHAAPMASRSRQAQVAAMENTARPWSSADMR